MLKLETIEAAVQRLVSAAHSPLTKRASFSVQGIANAARTRSRGLQK
jgi:hypothetical protein